MGRPVEDQHRRNAFSGSKYMKPNQKLRRAIEIHSALAEVASDASRYRAAIIIGLKNSWDEGVPRMELAVPDDLVETIIVAASEVAKAKLADLQAAAKADIPEEEVAPSRMETIMRYARWLVGKSSKSEALGQ